MLDPSQQEGRDTDHPLTPNPTATPLSTRHQRAGHPQWKSAGKGVGPGTLPPSPCHWKPARAFPSLLCAGLPEQGRHPH